MVCMDLDVNINVNALRESHVTTSEAVILVSSAILHFKIDTSWLQAFEIQLPVILIIVSANMIYYGE